jgi:hypothetical protein
VPSASLSVTAFITNYAAIRAARPQAAMDVALGEPGAAFLGSPDMGREFVSIEPPAITQFPEAEVPDLFILNRRFNWKKPHGQWMNQLFIQEQIEWHLRIASRVVGLAVGVLSLLSLWRKLRRR